MDVLRINYGLDFAYSPRGPRPNLLWMKNARIEILLAQKMALYYPEKIFAVFADIMIWLIDNSQKYCHATPMKFQPLYSAVQC